MDLRDLVDSIPPLAELDPPTTAPASCEAGCADHCHAPIASRPGSECRRVPTYMDDRCGFHTSIVHPPEPTVSELVHSRWVRDLRAMEPWVLLRLSVVADVLATRPRPRPSPVEVAAALDVLTRATR